MTPELIALIAALFFAVTSILSKKGLETSDPTSAATLCVLFQAIILAVAAIVFVPVNLFFNGAVLIFILSGFLSAFAGARLEFLALNKVGASVTSSLTSVSPLFATIAAVVLLSERPTVFTAIGTCSIVIGVVFLCLKMENAKGWKTNGIVIALFAALLQGLSAIPRKIALGMVNAPLLGSLVESCAGFFFFAVYLGLLGKKLSFNRTSLGFFSLRSLFNALALSFLFVALSIGSVTTVSPLGETSPLFVVLLSMIFLRKVEKVTAKTVVGATLIVMGSALIMAL
jgi:uncharacterized membrane protein